MICYDIICHDMICYVMIFFWPGRGRGPAPAGAGRGGRARAGPQTPRRVFIQTHASVIHRMRLL